MRRSLRLARQDSATVDRATEGQVVGETDARAELPKDRPIRPEDITKTVYYAMGIKDLEAKDKLGRAYNLLDEGKPLTELFG